MKRSAECERASARNLLAYEAPTVERLGSFESMTRGGINGDFTDAVFPAGTPRGNITFYDPAFS